MTVSLISHGQNALANRVLRDLQTHCARRIKLIYIENIADEIPLDREFMEYPIQRIRNDRARGFGANHNAAFATCTSEYFCVINPDVRIQDDVFALLLETLAHETASAVGPQVRSSAGRIEDNARLFPTGAGLVRRMFSGSSGPDYATDRGPIRVEWLAGMFILFKSDAFHAVGGFDERYFLYYEDADICRRLGQSGSAIWYDPRVAIVHDARRGSHRDMRLAMHHISSAVRFLTTRP